MRRVLLLLSLIFISSSTMYAQKMRYEEKTDVFFGINMGSTWHTSDVRNVDHGVRGLGFILGGSFNHDYGKTFSYDLRFRGMYGVWNGMDTETTSAIEDNAAISQYYDEFALQNFRATQFRTALELAIHWNSLRERTGLDPYVFGGLGFTWTESAGDFLDSDGLPYDFGASSDGSMLNGTYETPLVKNSNGDFYDPDSRTRNLLPSVGFGLGYYFTNRFSMGLEHKSTFFSSDFLDGTVANQAGAINGNNDIYHYTGVYARWYLKPANEKEEPRKPTPPPAPPTTAVPPPTKDVTPPTVRYTLPSSSPHVTSAPTITIRATVENVSSSQHVLFRQDGVEKHNFTFNSLTNAFQSTVQLNPGQNIFRLRGTNNYGSDDATMIIVYETEQGQPPVVTISDPSTNPHTTNSNRRNVTARIQNVSAKNQVTATLNGQTVGTDFLFNATGLRNFEREMELVPGANQVRVSATNEFGTDSDEITIIYDRVKEEEKIEPPVVDISNPSSSNRTVSTPNFQIRGSVLNVSDVSNISFLQNGTSNSNFSYSTSNQNFVSNVVLTPGANIFQLIGTNSAGSDQKTVIITYDEPSPTPPIVTINNPHNNPHMTINSSQNFNATIVNVDQVGGVSMTLNGQPFTNFNFTPSSGNVSAVLPLNEGANTVRVTGTNNDGSDSKQTVIIYQKPVTISPPVVEFVQPSSSPKEVEEENYTVRALVSNVDTKQQTSVVLNGVSISNYTFNASNGMVSFETNLMEGVNTVLVSGANEAGSDSKMVTIIYKKPERLYPPVVAFLKPTSNPKTVYTSSYEVEARVKHVELKQQVQVRINGVSTNNFVFDAIAERVNFTTSLVSGANSIEIKATNDQGEDVETTTIIFIRQDPINPPVVDILTPIENNKEVSLPSKTVQATLLNVASANDIVVQVNGSQESNFTFNTATKVLNMSASLLEGENNVVITGYNSAGSDSDQRTIIYNKEKEIDLPYVTFINPPQPGHSVTHPTFFMKADVINVAGKSDIRVIVNGQLVPAANFNYNPATREVTYTANLSAGNNSFVVRGINPAGTHEAGTNVVYSEPLPECETPQVAFTQPSTSNSVVENDKFMLRALVHHVNSESDITLLVNGVPMGNFDYNETSHQLKRQVELAVGNNVIEIIAQTDCGRVDKTVFVNYQPIEEVCESPIVDIIRPNQTGYSTQNETVDIQATVSHVDNIQQLNMLVNGNSINFDYDLGTHMITAAVSLQLGSNSVVLVAANECGQNQAYWVIQREVCNEPVIQVTSNPGANGETADEKIVISGTITDVTENEIAVQHNGSSRSFTYNEVNQSFRSEINLNEGNNTITLSAENNCGKTTETITITYIPVVPIDPPTVNITDPASAPYETAAATKKVKAVIQNVQSSSQINVSVNGSSRSFDFSASTGLLSFDQNLQVGMNTIVITAVNESGSASDETLIRYEKPVVILPPSVNFVLPSQDTTVQSDGIIQVTGIANNISSSSQLEIYVNDTEINSFDYQVHENEPMQFSLPVTISPSHHEYTILVIATNESGAAQDQLNILYEVEEEEEEEEEQPCEAEIEVTFNPYFSGVEIESNKPITFVAFKFSDDSVEEFPNLVGNKASLRIRDAQNREKCIVGVWVVSGCLTEEQQDDYGIWFENSDYDGSCEEEPCETPVIRFSSKENSNSSDYELMVEVEHVAGNEVEILWNNTPLNCSFSSRSSLFTCNVQLEEGENQFKVTVNACETVTDEYTVTYNVPCEEISGTLVYPEDINYATTEQLIDINLIVNHAELSGISVTVNGQIHSNVQLQESALSIEGIRLSEGQNEITVTAENECSNQSITYTVELETPEACGPRINPGNSDWEFCLVTPSGVFNRSDLEDPNFSYSGVASSVYFLPIAGGGNATVNGQDYAIQPGRYYLFEGKLTVAVNSLQPGSMGHWQVCVSAFSEPLSGNGRNRPPSPCEETGADEEPKEDSDDLGRPSIPNSTKEPTRPVTSPGNVRLPLPGGNQDENATPSRRPTRTTGTIQRPAPTQEPNTATDAKRTSTRITIPSRNRTQEQEEKESTPTRTRTMNRQSGQAQPNDTIQPQRTSPGRIQRPGN